MSNLSTWGGECNEDKKHCCFHWEHTLSMYIRKCTIVKFTIPKVSRQPIRLRLNHSISSIAGKYIGYLDKLEIG